MPLMPLFFVSTGKLAVDDISPSVRGQVTVSLPEGLTRPAWLFLALSAAATGLSWIFYFQALKAGETARVSAVDKFSLVLTLVLAALFLGEPMSARTVAGVAAITAGTLLIVW